MYINIFVIPVPEENRDAYKAIVNQFWDIARDAGALSQTETWEVDVPDGKVTDFRKAVNASDGEKIVVSWLTWPDKASAEAGQAKMREDERMAAMGAGGMPFDGMRMIMGGFEILAENAAG